MRKWGLRLVDQRPRKELQITKQSILQNQALTALEEDTLLQPVLSFPQVESLQYRGGY
jgi:hypothetical protein